MEGVKAFRSLLAEAGLGHRAQREVLLVARIDPIEVTRSKIASLDTDKLTPSQLEALKSLAGQTFDYRWSLADSLEERSEAWKTLPESTVNKLHNREIRRSLDYLYRHFEARE